MRHGQLSKIKIVFNLVAFGYCDASDYYQVICHSLLGRDAMRRRLPLTWGWPDGRHWSGAVVNDDTQGEDARGRQNWVTGAKNNERSGEGKHDDPEVNMNLLNLLIRLPSSAYVSDP